MPERRLPDPPNQPSTPCLHPEHAPAGHIVREPGTYEHTCPACGAKVVFVVGGVTWTNGTPDAR